MSEQNHPSINAAGLTVDIIKAIRSNLRRPVDSLKMGQILEEVETDILGTVSSISEKLDKILVKEDDYE